MLEYLKEFGAKSNQPADQAVGKIAEAALTLRGGKDIPMPALSTKQTQSEQPQAQDELDRILAEYKSQPLTPELVTKTWQTFLRSSVEKSGLSFPVGDIPACDRTAEELEQLRKEGRFMVYVPDVDYPLLGKIFPKMQSYATQEGSPIKDKYQSHGWIDVEGDLESPDRNTTEKDLEKLFESKGKRGQTLKAYIWASQFNKALTGNYFDEKDSWSRLLGSRRGGNVARVGFYSHGGLRVGWGLGPQDRDPDLGGRSEGVKKA